MRSGKRRKIALLLMVALIASVSFSAELFAQENGDRETKEEDHSTAGDREAGESSAAPVVEPPPVVEPSPPPVEAPAVVEPLPPPVEAPAVVEPPPPPVEAPAVVEPPPPPPVEAPAVVEPPPPPPVEPPAAVESPPAAESVEQAASVAPVVPEETSVPQQEADREASADSQVVDTDNVEAAAAALERAEANGIDVTLNIDGAVVDASSVDAGYAAETAAGSDPYFRDSNGVWFGFHSGAGCASFIPADHCVAVPNPIQTAVTCASDPTAVNCPGFAEIPFFLVNSSVEIFVEAGNYAENVIVPVPVAPISQLILSGAQAAVDARLRGGASESQIFGSIQVDANNVTIRGFTITTDNPGNGDGIIVSNAVVGTTIENNIIRGFFDGITLDTTTDTTIENNVFAGNIDNDVQGFTDTNLSIVDNAFRDVGEDSAIEIADTTGLEITGNTFVQTVPTNSFAIVDIFVPNGQVEIERNSFTLQGTQALGRTLDALQIDTQGSAAGTAVSIQENVFNGNNVDTNGDGDYTVAINIVDFSGGVPTAAVEIRRNHITGFAAGIVIEGDTQPVTIIEQNNIFNNSVHNLLNQTGTNVNAPNNYWGCAAPPCDFRAAGASIPGFLPSPVTGIPGATIVAPPAPATLEEEAEEEEESAEPTSEPPRLLDTTLFVVFQLSDLSLDIYTVNQATSQGDFLTRYSAAELALFIQQNPFASGSSPVLFDQTTGPQGTVTTFYLGNNTWLSQYSAGGVLISQGLFRTDPALAQLPVITAFSIFSSLRGTQGTYIVRFGDTLSAIGRRFGVSVTDLVLANNIRNPNLIFPNQRLVIPQPTPLVTSVLRSLGGVIPFFI